MDSGQGSNSLVNREGSTFTLEASEIDSFLLAKKSLVGKIMGGQVLNRGAVKNILLKAWGDPAGVHTADMGMNLFMFIFNTIKETLEVINRGLWFVMNHLISLQRWIPQASIYENDFNWVPFWI